MAKRKKKQPFEGARAKRRRERPMFRFWYIPNTETTEGHKPKLSKAYSGATYTEAFEKLQDEHGDVRLTKWERV